MYFTVVKSRAVIYSLGCFSSFSAPVIITYTIHCIGKTLSELLNKQFCVTVQHLLIDIFFFLPFFFFFGWLVSVGKLVQLRAGERWLYLVRIKKKRTKGDRSPNSLFQRT